MTIGERLLNLRKEKNISQEELADILGVSRQTISKWELDQTTPDFDKLVPLCEYFGITSDELLTGRKNYVEEKAKDKKTSFAVFLSISIALYIISIIFVILFAAVFAQPIIGVCLFLITVAIATGLIIFNAIVNKSEKKPKVEKKESSDSIANELKYNYRTDFTILLNKPFNAKTEQDLKNFLEALGDSINIVPADGNIKVHCHTNDPGLIIQRALKQGVLTDVKVENLKLEGKEDSSEVKEEPVKDPWETSSEYNKRAREYYAEKAEYDQKIAAELLILDKEEYESIEKNRSNSEQSKEEVLASLTQQLKDLQSTYFAAPKNKNRSQDVTVLESIDNINADEQYFNMNIRST